jgi:hypothetical protein
MMITDDHGPPADVDGFDDLDAAELRAVFQALERQRRLVEHALARAVGAAERRRAHRLDGAATVAGWCRAAGRWSRGEIRDRTRAGRLLESCPAIDRAFACGDIGVAQVFELARAHANPRCGDQLVEVADAMVEHARTLSYDEFRIVVRRWEMLADLDGAEQTAGEAHERRDAFVATVGDEMHVQAHGGTGTGAIVREVFDRFVDAEFSADWEATVARHGDRAAFDLMPRTDAQRRHDALVAIFRRAAANQHDASRAPLPLVNLVVDVHTLDALINDATRLPTPTDPRTRRCETVDGTIVAPSDVMSALWWGHVRRVVVDPQGVVLDMGRRRRLFTGNAREAVMLQARRCVAAGCDAPLRRCQADHVVDWQHRGPSDQRNAAPLCGRHNRLKNEGFTVWRDDRGIWHTVRPDGTEIT